MQWLDAQIIRLCFVSFSGGACSSLRFSLFCLSYFSFVFLAVVSFWFSYLHSVTSFLCNGFLFPLLSQIVNSKPKRNLRKRGRNREHQTKKMHLVFFCFSTEVLSSSAVRLAYLYLLYRYWDLLIPRQWCKNRLSLTRINPISHTIFFH